MRRRRDSIRCGPTMVRSLFRMWQDPPRSKDVLARRAGELCLDADAVIVRHAQPPQAVILFAQHDRKFFQVSDALQPVPGMQRAGQGDVTTGPVEIAGKERPADRVQVRLVIFRSSLTRHTGPPGPNPPDSPGPSGKVRWPIGCMTEVMRQLRSAPISMLMALL